MAAVAAIIFGLLALYDIAGIHQQGNGPVAALQQFCAYETHQDYEDAYAMVSDLYAHLVTREQFIEANQARDQRYGYVTSCSQIQRDYFGAFGPAHATFGLAVTTTLGTYHGSAMLALQNRNQWKIDGITPQAHLDG